MEEEAKLVESPLVERQQLLHEDSSQTRANALIRADQAEKITNESVRNHNDVGDEAECQALPALRLMLESACKERRIEAAEFESTRPVENLIDPRHDSTINRWIQPHTLREKLKDGLVATVVLPRRTTSRRRSRRSRIVVLHIRRSGRKVGVLRRGRGFDAFRECEPGNRWPIMKPAVNHTISRIHYIILSFRGLGCRQDRLALRRKTIIVSVRGEVI